MSKWEDTVISTGEIDKHYHYAEYTTWDLHIALDKIAKAQAEISFKAGYEQAREEMNLQSTSLADLFLEHRREGMREVVEWLNLNAYPSSSEYFCYNLGDLQAKLKDWGISEPEIDETQELAGLRHNASDDTIG